MQCYGGRKGIQGNIGLQAENGVDRPADAPGSLLLTGSFGGRYVMKEDIAKLDVMLSLHFDGSGVINLKKRKSIILDDLMLHYRSHRLDVLVSQQPGCFYVAPGELWLIKNFDQKMDTKINIKLCNRILSSRLFKEKEKEIEPEQIFIVEVDNMVCERKESLDKSESTYHD